MELETLEIFIEANVEKFEQQMAKVAPFAERVMNNLENMMGTSISKTEKNMDVGNGVNNMNKQFEQMNKMIQKQTDMMEKIMSTTTDNIDKGLSKGFQQSRKKVGKEVDALVKDINAKMGRAKAEQEKLAFLQAQRQDASSKGDTKNVVKYDTQIARAQDMMNKYQSSAKRMADGIRNEFKTLPQALDGISAEMQKNESVIEGQKAKVRELTALYEQQAKKVSKLSQGQLSKLYEKYGSTYDPGYKKEVKQAGFKFEDTKSSKKTGAEITKYSKEIQKLIAKNDALQQSYAQAEDRTKQLRSAVKGLNTELGKSTIQTGNAALGTKKIGQGADRSKQLFSRFGGVFNRTSNNIAHGSRRMSSGMGGFTRRLNQMVKQAFVFATIYKGLQLVNRGFMSALKTNDEFNNSLNQIKVNLMTAFYPIYTFVLPAINAMMRGLSAVTGQIAHFTASLFGTTYTAAKQGAGGLYQNIQAMNDSGNTADKTREKVKKLQRSLMGFDEINRIGLDDSKDDDIKLDNKPGTDFNTPVPATPDWINKANSILRDFFKPFQDSWAKHGQGVINAWKYALGEIVELSKSIGRSFMDVWTNGTGERTISNMLILLTNMLNLVGDIAKSFRKAWDENERGTKLIQSIFDMFNSFLELVDELTESFRRAWNENELGVSIFANLLEIATNINETVGNLADKFKEAWSEGEVGQSIFSTLLTFIDSMLESINKMTEATAKWAKKLDFTPLLKSIDGLLKSIEPLTKNVFDGIGWFYENVLLPLAGFTITDVIPTFFDLLSGAIDVVNSVIKALKPLGKWLWDSFLKPMAEWTGGVIVDVLGNVANGLKGISEWIDNNQSKIETLAAIVGSFAAAWGLVNGAMVVWNVVGGIAAGITTALAGAVAILTSPITLTVAAIGGLIAVGVLLWKNWDKISEKAGNLGKAIGDKWDGIKTATKESWNNVKDKTKEVWDDVSTKVKTKTGESWTNTKENWKKVKDDTSDKFENVRRTTVEKWDKTKDKVSAASSNAKINAEKAWSTMKNKVSGYNDTIKTNTDKAFNAVVGWAKDLGGKLGDKLAKGFDAVKDGAKALGKGIWEFPMKAINGIIKGVSWVLNLVGATETAEKMKSYSFEYAQGTGYHPGGMALVNDGYGANYREAYQLPNGQQGLFPNQRNLMVDLPAGSSVLSGPRTASMMSGMPNYAGGIGKWMKKKWDGAVELAGDVWDYASNPGKLVEAGISRYADLKGAIEPALSISQGAIGTSMDAATSFVKTTMESLFDSSDADTSVSNMSGVMTYLANIARDVMNKYPGMSVTSGYRHGDPYSHGKRQAIDIAYPSSMNGSSKYWGPANYAFEKFRDKVAYVITQGQVRDRNGLSGSPATSQWVPWRDGDHYDHLHINGSIAEGQGGHRPSSSPGGSGVGRWRSSILKAARFMGQGVSPGQVNGILAQIQRESGGNDKITQDPRVWDVNMANGNPARGLLQYIPQTFRAYAVRGYGNIMDGFHQLMAFFNNSNWRNDIQYGNSGWGPRGSRIRPYAKGSPYIPEDQLAMIHKGEMVVPASFNPMNPANNFQTLKMPDLFNETPQPITYNQTTDKTVGGGMNGATEGIINAVMMALSMRDTTPQQGGDTKIVVQMPDGKVLLDVVADEHNKFTDRQNYSPFKI